MHPKNRSILVHLSLLAIALTCPSWSQAAEPAQKRTLRLLAYNIHHGAGTDGRMDLNRIADIIRQAKPDLVALQEVDRNCTRSGKVDTVRELGAQLGMESRFGKFMDFQGGEYGLAVLSKHPIQSSRRIALPPGPTEPRCALEVQVRPWKNHSTISFLSIHNDWLQETARVAQVQTVLKALDQTKHPVILAGDFNGQPESDSIRLLTDADWTMTDSKSAKTFPSDEPRIKIDYIFFNGFPEATTETLVIDERIASDHRPLLGILQF